MKKLILLILCSSSLMAQEFHHELVGKMVPVKIMLPDYRILEGQMQYETFEYLKFPTHSFRLHVEAMSSGPYDHTGGILAFMIDGNIWALRRVPNTLNDQFVILTRQGAIEQYEYVKYGKEGDARGTNYGLLPTDSRTISVARKVGTNDVVIDMLSDDRIRTWIADIPEVVEDVKKAEADAQARKKKQDSIAATGGGKPKEPTSKGLLGGLEKMVNKAEVVEAKMATQVDWSRILNNYNAAYHQRNPNEIQYLFADPARWKELPKTGGDKKAESAARMAALYAGRSSVVSPEMASAKDNMPVKKETFAAKMNRIKSDGNKIGVLVSVLPVRVPKPTNSTNVSFSEPIDIEGEYMDESLRTSGDEFLKELQQALGTTDIEMIDIAKIPYREVKVLGMPTRVDDFWATKYKVVFAYKVDPKLEVVHDSFDGKPKFSATLALINSLLVTEYIGAPASKEQDNITQVTNLGNFRSPAFTQDEDIMDVQVIYEKTVEKLKMPVLDKIRAERGDGVKKMVDKKLN